MPNPGSVCQSGQPLDGSGEQGARPAAEYPQPQYPQPQRPRSHDATRRPGRLPTHGHLWSLPDGTGLHAPYGELVIEAGTGRLCCHLCGRWFVSLGGHLRAHGHTAESYREAMGLCRTRRLVADTLSRSIAARQRRAYLRSPAARARLTAGQELSRTGQLARLALKARPSQVSPELARIRQAALDAGRVTRAVRRDQARARRLRDLGVSTLAEYLHREYAAGASLRRLARATGLGWARLRREIAAAGITAPDARQRPIDQPTRGGQRG